MRPAPKQATSGIGGGDDGGGAHLDTADDDDHLLHVILGEPLAHAVHDAAQVALQRRVLGDEEAEAELRDARERVALVYAALV